MTREHTNTLPIHEGTLDTFLPSHFVSLQIKSRLSDFYRQFFPHMEHQKMLEEVGKFLDPLLEIIKKEGVDTEKIISISLHTSHIIIVHKTGEKEAFLSINLDSKVPLENRIGSFSPENIIAKETEKQLVLEQENTDLENILGAMEYIFQKNKDEEFRGKLDTSDILKTSEFDTSKLKLSGKTMQELGSLAGDKIAKIRLIRNSIWDKKISSDSIIRKNFETYIHYIMGIGDIYEQGAGYFKKTPEEIHFLVGEIVNACDSNTELFLKMGEIHKKIDDNNYQTTTVERHYKYFFSILNQVVLLRLKNPHTPQEDFLTFAQLVSGRDFEIDGRTYRASMDSRLYNPEMANKALMKAMVQPSGIIERIDIQDSSVGNRSAHSVFRSTARALSHLLVDDDGNSVDGKELLDRLGFADLLENKKRYTELSYNDKVRVGVLARLREKITPSRLKKQKTRISELQSMFQEIGKDAVEDIVEEISDATDWHIFDWDGTDSEELGLKKGSPEAKIYDLFRDINGSGGLFEVSDSNQELLKDGAKMAAIVAGAMIIGTIVIMTLPVSGTIGAATAGNLLVQGGIYGVSASVTSWGLDYAVGDAVGYGSTTEAVTNIGTDILVGAGTGAFGGYLVKRFGVAGATNLISHFRNTSIFVGDLAILGVGGEAARLKLMDQIFHNDPLFQDSSVSHPSEK